MSQETPETTLDFETEIVAVEEKIAHLEQISKEEYNAINFLIEWLNQDLYIYNAKDIVKEVPND